MSGFNRTLSASGRLFTARSELVDTKADGRCTQGPHRRMAAATTTQPADASKLAGPLEAAADFGLGASTAAGAGLASAGEGEGDAAPGPAAVGSLSVSAVVFPAGSVVFRASPGRMSAGSVALASAVLLAAAPLAMVLLAAPAKVLFPASAGRVALAAVVVLVAVLLAAVALAGVTVGHVD